MCLFRPTDVALRCLIHSLACLQVWVLYLQTQLKKLVVVRMKTKTSRSLQRSGRGNHVRGGGPNWVLVAGGVLLSTLSVRLGCKLKQLFDGKQENNTSKGLMSPNIPICSCNLDFVSVFFLCLLMTLQNCS